MITLSDHDMVSIMMIRISVIVILVDRDHENYHAYHEQFDHVHGGHAHDCVW